MLEDNSGNDLQSHVNVSYLSISKAAIELSLQLSLWLKKVTQVDSEILAKRWSVDCVKAACAVR